MRITTKSYPSCHMKRYTEHNNMNWNLHERDTGRRYVHSFTSHDKKPTIGTGLRWHQLYIHIVLWPMSICLRIFTGISIVAINGMHAYGEAHLPAGSFHTFTWNVDVHFPLCAQAIRVLVYFGQSFWCIFGSIWMNLCAGAKVKSLSHHCAWSI